MENIIDFLSPLKDSFFDFIETLPKGRLGKEVFFNQNLLSISFVPNSIVIFGIPEDRNAVNNKGTGENLNTIRKEFYQLYSGNWNLKVYDLGDIKIGATFNDTQIAVEEIVAFLLQQKLLPIMIGGSQALTYAAYRAYDKLEQKVNLAIVDAKFDLGNIEQIIDSQSYLTKIIMEKPNNLFNFTNIGYQTFLNSQEEINLLDTLLFDTYRLGDVKNDLEIVEPVLRDVDMLSIDVGAIRCVDAPANANTMISGLSADDICKITRYAGLSDKLSVLGIYEYNEKLDNNLQTGQLIAQMIWYYMEGVNYRSYEFPTLNLNNFKKYMVMIDEDTYNFYKSDISGRWWMEINVKDNNKTKRRTLIPCTYNDYLSANRQEVPNRWFVNRRKLS
jgi:arginase family enzyme